jgi:hypothetical protein
VAELQSGRESRSGKVPFMIVKDRLHLSHIDSQEIKITSYGWHTDASKVESLAKK